MRIHILCVKGKVDAPVTSLIAFDLSPRRVCGQENAPLKHCGQEHCLKTESTCSPVRLCGQ